MRVADRYPFIRYASVDASIENITSPAPASSASPRERHQRAGEEAEEEGLLSDCPVPRSARAGSRENRGNKGAKPVLSAALRASSTFAG